MDYYFDSSLADTEQQVTQRLLAHEQVQASFNGSLPISPYWTGSPFTDDADVVQSVVTCLDIELDDPLLLQALSTASRALNSLPRQLEPDTLHALNRCCLEAGMEKTFLALLQYLLSHIDKLLDLLSSPLQLAVRLAAVLATPICIHDSHEALRGLVLRLCSVLDRNGLAKPALKATVRLYASCSSSVPASSGTDGERVCKAAVSLLAATVSRDDSSFTYVVDAIAEVQSTSTLYTSWGNRLLVSVLNSLYQRSSSRALANSLLQHVTTMFRLLSVCEDPADLLQGLLQIDYAHQSGILECLSLLCVEAAERVAQSSNATNATLSVWELRGVLPIWDGVNSQLGTHDKDGLALRMVAALRATGTQCRSSAVLDTINMTLRSLNADEIGMSRAQAITLDVYQIVNQVLDDKPNGTNRSPLEYVVKRYEGDQFRKQSVQAEENARPPSTHLDAFR